VTTYDAMAKHYDSAIGDRTGDRRFLAELMESHGVRGGRLLELACGTGEMLLSFGSNFFVTGLDRSGEMLERAKMKLPRTRFIQSDMRDFEIDDRFDVILCLFNSLNQLTEKEDWNQVFRCVARHLNSDGVFILELNMPQKFERLLGMKHRYHSVGGEHYVMEVTPLDAGNAAGVIMDILMFVPDSQGAFMLVKEKIEEIALDRDEVVSKLSETFRALRCYDRSNGTEATARTEVAFFICAREKLRPLSETQALPER
jgi:ubiquinone/menaquinone biosynthesis C-methylase UbiE